MHHLLYFLTSCCIPVSSSTILGAPQNVKTHAHSSGPAGHASSSRPRSAALHSHTLHSSSGPHAHYGKRLAHREAAALDMPDLLNTLLELNNGRISASEVVA